MKKNNGDPCEGCQHHSEFNMRKLGVNTGNYDHVVALAGNPNTGKSSVFNALTGLRQHTGNWPGKTIGRAEGGFSFNNKKYKLIDLPGTYSLLSISKEEQIARDFILFGKPDVTVIVVDAGRLERNLNLAIQILEITDKAVLCLNLVDEARRNNISVDERTLSKDLGIPVVGTVARDENGIPELIETIHRVANGEISCNPYRIKSIPKHIDKAVHDIANAITGQYPGISNSRWLAFRLLQNDKSVIQAIENNELSAFIKTKI